ncbi:MAG: tetratricopeptide repeat protein [Desulfobacteraceae bacterium]|nr:tetratricopeptide repeat protein [Desulfobacteraceae bacterium]
MQSVDVLSVKKKDITPNTLTPNTYPPEYYSRMGMTLQAEGRFDEAVAAFRKALEMKPDMADACGNMGNVYLAQGKVEEAIDCYRKVLTVKPDSFEAYNNMGNCYLRLNRYEEAMSAFQKAIEIKPDLAEAYNNLGTVYKSMDRLEEAFSCFQKAIEIKPDFPEAYSNFVPHLQALCYWNQLAVSGKKLDELTQKNLEKGLKAPETPFEHLSRFSDPAMNLKVAASWANHIAMPMKHIRNKFDFNSRRNKHEKQIIIGYLSNDFCNHPVGHLTVSMFGLHNRNKFKVFAYSYGRNDNSYFRKRIEQECDHFVDIREMSHQEAANRIYADGVDILIDLMGYTKDHRLEICAFRPAPIQISWLGYPGTSGADFFDYIITDKMVTPPEHEPYFSEKVILMPYTYMVTNHTQPISDKQWQRKDLGIPDNAFVFCSFNQSYKIEPIMFDVWMRIMRQIPESVLWLSVRYQTAVANLKREAEIRGVNANRLIFAEKLALKEDYLARLGFADLALDTMFYNGHATTSDALWAGVPVITLQGGHFPSRVASSVLNAVGLPELVTHSLEEYEQRILYLHKKYFGISAYPPETVQESSDASAVRYAEFRAVS